MDGPISTDEVLNDHGFGSKNFFFASLDGPDSERKWYPYEIKKDSGHDYTRPIGVFTHTPFEETEFGKKFMRHMRNGEVCMLNIETGETIHSGVTYNELRLKVALKHELFELAAEIRDEIKEG